MTYHYSPHTGEYIAAATPAAWMGQTSTPPPAFDGATAGCFWRGTAWELVQAVPAAAQVPTQVTMRQARLALLGAGLLSQVNAAIASLPSPQKEAAQIDWEFAATVDRSFGLVPAMGAALGMTNAQLDALFVQAAAL